MPTLGSETQTASNTMKQKFHPRASRKITKSVLTSQHFRSDRLADGAAASVMPPRWWRHVIVMIRQTPLPAQATRKGVMNTGGFPANCFWHVFVQIPGDNSLINY